MSSYPLGFCPALINLSTKSIDLVFALDKTENVDYLLN